MKIISASLLLASCMTTAYSMPPPPIKKINLNILPITILNDPTPQFSNDHNVMSLRLLSKIKESSPTLPGRLEVIEQLQRLIDSQNLHPQPHLDNQPLQNQFKLYKSIITRATLGYLYETVTDKPGFEEITIDQKSIDALNQSLRQTINTYVANFSAPSSNLASNPATPKSPNGVIRRPLPLMPVEIPMDENQETEKLKRKFLFISENDHQPDPKVPRNN